MTRFRSTTAALSFAAALLVAATATVTAAAAEEPASDLVPPRFETRIAAPPPIVVVPDESRATPSPATVIVAPEGGMHAPKYALWTGLRGSFMAFGFGFFRQNSGTQATETTGNFIGKGFAPQLDLGVRLAHRFVPYLFWEHGFMGQGRRFAGSDATSSSTFYGLGFRYGGADRLGILVDLSAGRRVIEISNGNESYAMGGLEFFKLGLGGELRVRTLFTLELMAAVSGGTLDDSKGSVTYSAEGSNDGRTRPDFENGAQIATPATYINMSVGAGIHFDVFGK